MKVSTFMEMTKDNKTQVYYSVLSGETNGVKWSNRIATIKDKLIFTNAMSKMLVVAFLGTNRVLNEMQAQLLEAVASVAKVEIEERTLKAGEIDLKTQQPLTADKVVKTLKSLTVEVTPSEILKLIEFIKSNAPAPVNDDASLE